MTTTTITPELLVAKIRELAKRHPDKVYQKPDTQKRNYCQYIHSATSPADIEMGCIFGHAFVELGLELQDFFRPNGVEYGDIYELIIVGVAKKHPAFDEYMLKDRDGLDWFMRTQNMQDNGETWLNAVMLADARAAYI